MTIAEFIIEETVMGEVARAGVATHLLVRPARGLEGWLNRPPRLGHGKKLRNPPR